MISKQRLFVLPVLLLATLAAAPSRADAQDSSAAQALTPPMAARITLSTSESPRLMLEAPDVRAIDRSLTRGRRFRRAGAVLAGVGGLLVGGGLIGVATYQEPDSCIVFCAPVGGYATMAVGGLVLGNALIAYLVPRPKIVSI